MRGAFEGKTVVVTGASRGIGRAVAERMAAGGARLVLGYRRDELGIAGALEACRGRGAAVTGGASIRKNRHCRGRGSAAAGGLAGC